MKYAASAVAVFLLFFSAFVIYETIPSEPCKVSRNVEGRSVNLRRKAAQVRQKEIFAIHEKKIRPGQGIEPSTIATFPEPDALPRQL